LTTSAFYLKEILFKWEDYFPGFILGHSSIGMLWIFSTRQLKLAWQSQQIIKQKFLSFSQQALDHLYMKWEGHALAQEDGLYNRMIAFSIQPFGFSWSLKFKSHNNRKVFIITPTNWKDD
jgi:hypothetical protein